MMTMRQLTSLLSLVLTGWLTSGCGKAADNATGRTATCTKAFDLSLIQIDATDRTVVLSGNVRNQAEKLLAEMIASGTEGVQKVVSNLRVLFDPVQ